MQAEGLRLAQLGTCCVLALLLSAGVCAGQAPRPVCPTIDNIVPLDELNHAIQDPGYGACFSVFASQQQKVCDAQPTSGDAKTMAVHRFCQQLTILFQDLSVNFLTSPPPGSAYLQAVTGCATSRASPPCNDKDRIEKLMRCQVVMLTGNSMGTDCLPNIPVNPPSR